MESRDESRKQGSRGSASMPREVKGSRNIYYDQRTGKYYRKLGPNPTWKWGSDEPSELYEELPAPPHGTAYFVGEGDFSYSNAYAQSNPGKFVKTTSYDSRADVEKYPQGKESLAGLSESDLIAVQHGVNVMLRPGSAPGAMSPRPVDMLQFNFPHTGTGSGSAEPGSKDFETFVKDNQNLVKGFFRNAQHKVTPDGLVRFTYKKQGPYLEWKVERIAADEGWEVIDESPFVAPTGYQHVLTKTADGTVGDDGAVTVTFKRKATTDAAKTSLSHAVDADDLERRLSAIVTSESSSKTVKRTPALTTSYHKEDPVIGTVVKLPRIGVPGFIKLKGRKKEIAFYNNGIVENLEDKPITIDTQLSFVIVEDSQGRSKAIKIKVL